MVEIGTAKVVYKTQLCEENRKKGII